MESGDLQGREAKGELLFPADPLCRWGPAPAPPGHVHNLRATTRWRGYLSQCPPTMPPPGLGCVTSNIDGKGKVKPAFCIGLLHTGISTLLAPSLPPSAHWNDRLSVSTATVRPQLLKIDLAGEL